jgi:hypothetical protein
MVLSSVSHDDVEVRHTGSVTVALVQADFSACMTHPLTKQLWAKTGPCEFSEFSKKGPKQTETLQNPFFDHAGLNSAL